MEKDDEEIEKLILELANQYEENPSDFGNWIDNLEGDMKGDLLLHLGIKSFNSHYFKMAIICWEKALKDFIKSNDKMGMGSCYNNIGTVYNIWGDYNKAIKYKEMAFDSYKNIDDNAVKSDFHKIDKELSELKKKELQLKGYDEFREPATKMKLSIKTILDGCEPWKPDGLQIVVG